VEAWVATRLLLMDPIDEKGEAQLLRAVKDERVPLLRRVWIDRGFWSRPNRPWVQSPDRSALVVSWARKASSLKEIENVALDLRGFGSVTSDSWVAHPETKKRALAIIEAVQAIQENPKASVHAKCEAVLAMGEWSAVAARHESFKALTCLAKESPHGEVRLWAASQLRPFAPFVPDEAAQVRKVLEASHDDTPRRWLEEALSKPSKP